MVYVRLRIANQSLSDNGILVLTIDDSEIETVTMLMNEVFGETNHLAAIIIKNNPWGRSTVSGASISYEYALFYSVNSSTKMGRLQRNEKQISRYKETDEDGRDRRWKWGLERTVGKDRDGDPTVYIKSRMKEEGMLLLTVWDDTKYSSTEYGTNCLTDLIGERYSDYPKSIYAVVDRLRATNAHQNAVILDFFSNSATIAHSVMQFNPEDGGNRKFIAVPLPEETIKTIAQKKPCYFVMRDSFMANDNVATNFESIFANYIPDTVRKAL